jgi:hypothetical protein
MNLKALITMLVLGASSAAVAAPAVTVSGSVEASVKIGTRKSPPVVIRDHRMPAPGWDRDHGYQPPVFVGPSNIKHNSDSSEYIGPIYSMPRWNERAWTKLTDPTRIELTRQIVRVSGRFDALMLQNVTGSSSIRLVKIRFADGGADQTIMLNKNLNSYQSSLQLNVQHRPIEYIVVYGTTNFNSSYRVLGT